MAPISLRRRHFLDLQDNLNVVRAFEGSALSFQFVRHVNASELARGPAALLRYSSLVPVAEKGGIMLTPLAFSRLVERGPRGPSLRSGAQMRDLLHALVALRRIPSPSSSSTLSPVEQIRVGCVELDCLDYHGWFFKVIDIRFAERSAAPAAQSSEGGTSGPDIYLMRGTILKALYSLERQMIDDMLAGDITKVLLVNPFGRADWVTFDWSASWEDIAPDDAEYAALLREWDPDALDS